MAEIYAIQLGIYMLYGIVRNVVLPRERHQYTNYGRVNLCSAVYYTMVGFSNIFFFIIPYWLFTLLIGDERIKCIVVSVVASLACVFQLVLFICNLIREVRNK